VSIGKSPRERGIIGSPAWGHHLHSRRREPPPLITNQKLQSSASGGIEGFAIEPIPEALKVVRWPDLFLLVSNFLINPSTILIGGLAVASGLSFWATILSSTLGIVFAFAAYIVMATVGVDYGITGQVACRMVFGIRGAKWLPSVMRTMASAYWFAVQTIVGATVMVAIAHQWTGRTYSVVRTGMVLAALQVLIALIGYRWLKLISRFALPVKVAGIVYLFWVLEQTPAASYGAPAVLHFHSHPGGGYLLAAVWLNSLTGAWLTMITDAADFCRYTRSRADMWWGTMLAGILATAFSVSLGAYGAAASLGRQPNPFSLAADVHPQWLTLLVLLIVIALDEITINVMNLYTGGLSLSNLWEGPGRFWNTLAVGMVSTFLSAFPVLLDRLVPLTTALGNLFAPLAGVLLFHYLFVAHMRIDVPALFDPQGIYRYWHGVNVTAVVWCFLGGGVYYLLPVGALPAVIVPLLTGAGYWLSMQWQAHPQPEYGLEVSPGE
jgi:nucleobase:cation symporter-1, NCS1 family